MAEELEILGSNDEGPLPSRPSSTAAPKRPTQSLRFDLVFDLSLLTLCALILSVGLLILVLRYEVPRDMGDLAQSYLTSLHESFLQSSELKETAKDSKSLNALNPTQFESAFKQFLETREMGKHWSEVRLELVRPAPQLDQLEMAEQQLLFVIPTVTEFILTRAVSSGELALRYHWSIQPFQESLTDFKYRVFLLTLLIEAVLVALGYYLLFRKNILVPIHNLSVGAREFLKENWRARISVERNDELGEVAVALNQMAQQIQEKEGKLGHTIDSLRKANEEIEAQQNEQLQIEKLASIGRLAAGVAHEMGNPLGAISGYIDILRRSMKKSPAALAEDLDLCDRIESETNRISKIIRALLQQARPAKERMKTVNLKAVAVRSVQSAQIPAGIDVGFEFEDENAEVFAEQDQLVQVLLNLLINARHAIEGRVNPKDPGRIRIRCVSRKLPFYRGNVAGEGQDLDTSIVRSLRPETYWVLSVEDNGVGISDADQKKLFEPFFSTKAPGKGTGLGLYVTKSIIESFRGAIVVRSALHYGASFSIFLPKAKNSFMDVIES